MTDSIAVLNVSSVEQLENLNGSGSTQPTQLARGPVSGRIMRAAAGDLILRNVALPGGLRMAGPLSETQLSFGTIIRAQGARLCSRDVGPGDLAVFPADYEHEASYRAEFEHMIVSCDPAVLHDFAKTEGLRLDSRLTGAAGLYRLAPSRAAVLRAGALRITRELARNPPLLESGNAARGLSDDTLRLFVRAFASVDIGGVGSRDVIANSKSIGRVAVYWIRTHTDGPLAISDICGDLDVSSRSLHRAFEAELGISPARYLKLFRLSRVRHDLARAAPGGTTVARAACHWGFWELGRFAGAYRSQFGELPSATLAR